jgi:hypothetical protein
MITLRRVAPFVLTFLAFVAIDARAQDLALSFSHESGLYPQAFDLSIDAPSGTTIRYTLDGSVPNDSSDALSGAILIVDEPYRPARLASIHTARDQFHQDPPANVRRATLVRAIGYGQDGAVSDVYTKTYFVGSAVPAGDLPVFSLIVDSTGFFGYDEGIYVPGRIYDERLDESLWIGHRDANYMETGRDWEREVLVQFFEDGALVHEQNAGARIHGGATRAFRQKSLRLYARSEYGSSNAFDFPLLGDPDNGGHRRLLLRNGGQDFDRAMLRDPLVHRLVGHLNFETQAYRPSHVFLNGEYWGLHNIRERYDEHELSRRHGVNPDDIVILDGNAVLDTGIPGDEQHFLQMRQHLLEHDVDEAAMEMVRERLDLSSFIDYHAAQIIVGNHDWPGNNIRFWRTRNGETGSHQDERLDRWRYIMFDLDDAFHGGPNQNTLELATEEGGTSWPNHDWSTIVLRRLLTNDGFRAEFIHRMSDLLNTSLSAQHIHRVIGDMSAAIEPAIPAQLERWRRYHGLHAWQSQVDQIAGYASERPGHVRSHMRGFFGIADEHTLSVDVPSGGGLIRVNHELIHSGTPGTEDPASPYPWSGLYFGDVPLTLTAMPDHGYRFKEWRIGGTPVFGDASLTISLAADSNVEAVFEPIAIDAMRPDPHVLADGPFVFNHWSADEPAGTFPYHMGFQQSAMDDPGLRDEMAGPYDIPESDYAADDIETIGFPYKNSARTRINGLGDDGISFINTGRGRDLGAAIVALDTRNVDAATVTWKGGTVLANSRVYHIRMQYRVGEDGSFQDVEVGGEPVEYRRRNENGHAEIIGPVALPPDALGEAYVQLRWKYYFTGERLNPNVGQRDELRLDDIRIEVGEPAVASRLSFGRETVGVQAGHPMRSLTLLALDEEGVVDTNVGGSVVLEIVDSAASLPAATMQNGQAVVSGLMLDLDPGLHRLTASINGLQSAELDIRVVRMTEVVMPRFIQGATPDNNDRVPFAYRIRIDGLEPGSTYRFANRVVDADDPPEQDGAGNMLFRSTSGSFVRNTDSPRFRDTDLDARHSQFLASAQGDFEGWFVTEPSGNRRFMPGDDLWMLVLLNDGRGSEEVEFSLRTETPVRVIDLSTESEGATGFTAFANVIPGSVALVTDSDGEVVNASVVHPLGTEIDDRFAAFYRRLVEDIPGAAGLVIPNDLLDGLVSISWLDWATGSTLRYIESEAGYFRSHSTHSLSGGPENPLSISFRSDAPTPVLPIHDAVEVDRLPTLAWEGGSTGGSYIVELAMRSDFVHMTFTSAQITESTLSLPLLEADSRYFWRVGSVSGDQVNWSSTYSFTTGHSVNVDDGLVPAELAIGAPFPNPSQRRSVLPIDLPTSEQVRVLVYDVLGRQVGLSHDGMLPAGRHAIEIAAGDLASGTYILRIEIGATSATRTMTVTR